MWGSKFLALRWWLDQDPFKDTVVTFTNFSPFLFTDACPKDWEARVEADMLQGKWEPLEQQFCINLLEMRAVSKAFQGFSFPPYDTVVVSLDNSTMVSYINREGKLAFSPF